MLTSSTSRQSPGSVPIAVFASGGGSNLRAIYSRFAHPDASVRIAFVLSNNSTCGAMQFAQDMGLHCEHLSLHRFRDCESPANEFEQAMHALLRTYRIQLVVLAGYLRLVPASIVRAYPNKIINVHPALLPAFGGPMMFGDRVHQAVLERGCKVSGATVHFVNEAFDQGPIIMQQPCEVRADDTLDSLRSRVRILEHSLLPAAIELAASGRIRVTNNIVHLH